VIGFLPERVFRILKEDSEYQEWESALNNALQSDDFVERIVKEEEINDNGGIELLAKRDAIFTRVLSPVLLRNAKIMETNDETVLMEMLKTEADLENKLFIYQNLIGIVHYLSTEPAVLQYIEEFIRLIEESKQVFSEKLHEEYFTYKCFLIKHEQFNHPDRHLTIGMFQDYCKQMDVMIEGICTLFGHTDYIVNLMRHCKVFQMFDFFATMMDYFGPCQELAAVVEEEVLPILAVNTFKYSEFNYYKLQLLDAIAKCFFDLRSEKYFDILGMIVEMINRSFTPDNREQSVKALNYLNDRWTMYYLQMVTKYRHIVECKIPEFPQKIVLEHMSAGEKAMTADFNSSPAVLQSQYCVAMHTTAAGIGAHCSIEMQQIKEYIDFNAPHFESFRHMASSKYGYPSNGTNVI
jgi:hypothetical protein